MGSETFSKKFLDITCRACMCQEKESEQRLQPIFDFSEENRDLSIVELLRRTTPQVIIQETDNLPKQICTHCLSRLVSAHDFQQMCLRSDFHMRSLLEYSSIEPKYSQTAKGDGVTLEIPTVDPLQAESITEDADIGGELTNCLKLELHEEEVPYNYNFVDGSNTECKTQTKDDIILVESNINNETSAIADKNFDSDFSDDNRSDKGDDYSSSEWENEKIEKKKISKLKSTKETESEKEDSNDIVLEKPNSSCRRTISVPCPECGKIFDRSYSLSRHMSVHNPTGKPHECTKCKYRFATPALLKRHEITHSVDWTKANESANTNPEGYKCNDCPRRFAKRESLSAHLQSHKKSKIVKETSKATDDNATSTTEMFSCDLCPKQFQKLKQLKRHSRSHDENKQFKCNLCEKAYSSNAHLQDHLNKHNGIKPYVCKYCNKSFQQSCTLKDHVRIHTGEQPYLCSECGRAFNSSSNMKQHLLRHAGVKRYECPECPKKFPCLSDLASHMAVHKKIKPHICDVCGAAFGKPFQLKKHKMYHNGEKPHKCEYCEMRFVCADHMRRHMRTHTGEKPYKCKYCERAFAQSNDLIKHLRSHIGENVYECELCPKAFRLAAELREHFSLHKNDDEETRTKNAQELSEKLARNAMSYVNTMCAILKKEH